MLSLKLAQAVDISGSRDTITPLHMFLLLRLLALPLKLAFGYDVFISYGRKDGAAYANRLADRISSRIAPRIDSQETDSGERLPVSLFLAVAFSRVLVVVGTRSALEIGRAHV